MDGVMSDGVNLFVYQTEQSDLKRKIEVKSFSGNKDISKLSIQILEKL